MWAYEVIMDAGKRSGIGEKGNTENGERGWFLGRGHRATEDKNAELGEKTGGD